MKPFIQAIMYANAAPKDKVDAILSSNQLDAYQRRQMAVTLARAIMRVEHVTGDAQAACEAVLIATLASPGREVSPVQYRALGRLHEADIMASMSAAAFDAVVMATSPIPANFSWESPEWKLFVQAENLDGVDWGEVEQSLRSILCDAPAANWRGILYTDAPAAHVYEDYRFACVTSPSLTLADWLQREDTAAGLPGAVDYAACAAALKAEAGV